MLKDDHKDEIDIVCYNQFCKEFRLNCFKCIQKGIHLPHTRDLQKVNSLEEFIEKKNKACDDLIDDLNYLVESVNQSFSQLKIGIKNKYSVVKDKLQHLNQQLINDFLNSIIKLTEQTQLITTIISEQTKHQLIHLIIYMDNYNYHHLIIKFKITVQNYQKYVERGYQLYMDDMYNQAIELFDKSIQSDPNNHFSLQLKENQINLKMQLLVWIKLQLLILSTLILYSSKATVQNNQINMRMQSLGQIKYQLSILSIFILYSSKANVQNNQINTRMQSLGQIKHQLLILSILILYSLKANVQNNQINMRMQSLGQIKPQLLILSIFILYSSKENVQNNQINMRMQSLGQIKHQLLILSILILYSLKANVQNNQINTRMQSLGQIKPQLLILSIFILYLLKGYVQNNQINLRMLSRGWIKHQLQILTMFVPQALKENAYESTKIILQIRLLKQYENADLITCILVQDQYKIMKHQLIMKIFVVISQ